MDERVDKIYASALDDHAEFADFDPDRLRSFIATELNRIDGFEMLGNNPPKLTYEMADSIGAIKVHSGVGLFDTPFKDGDNPKLKGKTFLAWNNRDRLKHGFNLALEAAEVLSGFTVPKDPTNPVGYAAEVRELIREFGPHLIYTGYPVETQDLEEVLRRLDAMFPIENAHIIHDTPTNTVEGAQMFRMPEGALVDGKKLVVVSHAPHLVRVLHILGKYPYKLDGNVLYVSPVATSDAGRDEFALLEIRGMMYYIFLAESAAEQPHDYRVLIDTPL